MLRAFEAIFVNRRLAVPSKTVQELMKRQEGLCAECGDPLSKYDVHHKKAVAMGGTNDIDNLMAVCRACHAKLTEEQRDEAGLGRRRTHTMASILCPLTYDVST